MGTYTHHVLTVFTNQNISGFHEAYHACYFDRNLTPIYVGYNDLRSFCIMPHGTKIEADEYLKHLELIESVKKVCKSHKCLHFCHTVIADEHGIPRVLESL